MIIGNNANIVINHNTTTQTLRDKQKMQAGPNEVKQAKFGPTLWPEEVNEEVQSLVRVG